MISVILAMMLLGLLQWKHFIFDFMYQPPYQYLNKGTYCHPGGLMHAGQHALGTMFILFILTIVAWKFILLIGLLEFILHYHIDWAKMKINKHYGWGCNTHEEFWKLLGLDQFLHQLTYMMIIMIVLI